MRFIITKKKDDLIASLNLGKVMKDDVVFIEDIKQIYTHGFYIGEFTETSESIKSTIESIVTSSTPVENFINQLMAESMSNVTLSSEGDGSMYLSNDGTYKLISFEDKVSYPILYHESTDNVISIHPNIFHIWNEIEELDLTLEDGQSTTTNEYLFQFISGDNPTTLILPDTIKWINDFPEIESNKIYQCSIINDIGIICGV